MMNAVSDVYSVVINLYNEVEGVIDSDIMHCGYYHHCRSSTVDYHTTITLQ